MKTGRASSTAMWVAALRGLAGLDDPSIVEDPFAAQLLPPRYAAGVHLAELAPRASRVVLRGAARATRNLVRHMAFRTRAIDDVVVADAEAGTRQVVLLGAGLDARAWRLDALSESVVFELDHPDTQRAKRDAIMGAAPRARVVWVPVDFTRGSIEAALEQAGHDPSQKTSFLWEGVTMYLSEADIDRAVAAAARRGAPGSSLVATYHGARFAPESAFLDLLVRAVGEPFRTRFSPDAVRALLGRHGFEVERDEGSSEWSARYLGERAYETNERLVVGRRSVREPADRRKASTGA